jgi:hypothetical protein
MLDIYAGNNALKIIQERGFKQELFTNFLGASGGPKWFSLFGLDKYLFGDFFKGRCKELNLIGSSAGSFRAACFAQKNPVSAIKRLADCYAHTSYSAKPNMTEISGKAIDLLDYVFEENSADEIINNDIFKAHFIIAKCHGLTSFDNKVAQSAGLLSSMMLNKLDRRLLRWQYQRHVYTNPTSTVQIDDPYGFSSHYIKLTPNNIKQALLASGSIPLVMSGVRDIKGSVSGMYRDGGIIDYHFDFSLNNIIINNIESNIKNTNQSLTLYPHFSPTPKAGWFDKNSKRKVLTKHYRNTVLLVPSEKFISTLPFGKIPDRTDFTQLDTKTRIDYWLTVLKETDKLADSFNNFLIKQDLAKIREFTP